MEKDTPCKHFQNKVGVAILLSDKVDFGTRNATPDKVKHNMIKGSVLQKNITILNEDAAPNIKTSKYMKQKVTELKGETHKSTVTFGDLNTSLSITNRTSRQKISKDKEYLKQYYQPT